MFDVEKPNALCKCIKLCINKSNQSIDIIFNIFSVILSACLLISIVSLSFDNDLNINEIHMLDVPYRGLGKSISQVDGKNCETSVYIDSNVSTDDDTILCQLNEIRGNNLNNVIIGLLNVNHFAGKYNDFKLIIPGNIDIMILVEIKLDNLYPTPWFLIDSYSTPVGRDRNKSGGCILVYAREDIPCKLLNLHRFPDDIEGLFLEVNLRKTKILLFATYHRPRQHDIYYFQCIGNALDVYSPKYEKCLSQGFEC